MSSSIDERIVEMQFDNKQFEAGIKESSETLEKFKKTLNLEGAARGLNEIENASRGVKLNGISQAIDTVNERFSTMGIIGMTVLQNLTNQAVNFAQSMLKSVTIEPISSGWSKYEQKLNSVQTIMNATGRSIDEVNVNLDKLNWFTDETSYSFTDMVANIAKFTSSNIPLEEAVTSMIGIADAAGLAGATTQDASHAMEGFSKAIAQGYMSRQNWQWIRTAHMDTTKFKEVLLEAAEAEGTLTKTAEGLYKVVGGKLTVSVEDFETALKDGWMTTKVMNRALAEFGGTTERIYEEYERTGDLTSDIIKRMNEAGDMTEDLGLKAFRAAQEAKTFTDALNSVKDAVSTGWMTTFELIFGNYEQAKVMWTDLANSLWDIFAAPGDARNQLLKEWRKDAEAQERFLQGLYDLFAAFGNIIYNVGDAFSSLFPPMTVDILIKITDAFANFASKFRAATEYGAIYLEALVEEVEGPLQACIVVFDEVSEAVEGTTQSIDEFAQAVLNGLYGNGIDRRKALESLGVSYEAVQNRVNELLGSSFRYRDEEGNIITSTKELKEATEEMVDVYAGATKVFDDTDLSNVKEETEEASEAVERMDTMGQNLHDTLVGIFSVLRIVSEAAGALTRNIIWPLVRTIVPAVLDGILRVTGFLGRLSFNLMKIIHDSQIFEKVFGAIGKAIFSIPKAFGEFIEAIKELSTVQTLMQYFQNFFDFLTNVKVGIFEGFSNLFSGLKDLKIDIPILDTFVAGFGILAGLFNSLIEMASPFTNAIGNAITSVVNGFKNLKLTTITPILDTIKQSLGGVSQEFGFLGEALKRVGVFSQKTFNKLFTPKIIDKIYGSLSKTTRFLLEKFGPLRTIFKDFFNEVAAGIKKSRDLGTGFEALGKAMEPLKDSLTNFFQPLLKVLSPITSRVKELFNTIVKALDTVDFMKILNYIKSGAAIAAILVFAKTLLTLSKVFSGIINLFDSIAGVFNQLKRTLQANVILQVALAVAILAGALYLLARVPAEQLKTALIALASVMVMMIALVALLTSVDGKQFAMAAGGILAISGSMMVLAGALALLANLDTNFYPALGRLVILLGLFLVVVYLINRITKSMSREDAIGAVGSMLGIYIFASAIKKTVDALVELAHEDLEPLKNKMSVLIGIMVALAAVAAAAAKISFGGSISLISMVAGLWLFVKLLQSLESVDFAKINKTLGKMSGIFVAIVALSLSARLAGDSLGGLGALFLGLGISLMVMAKAIEIFAKIDGSSLAKGVAALLAVLFGMAGIIAVTKNFKGQNLYQMVLVFTGLSVALIAATACIWLLSEIAKTNAEGIKVGTAALLAMMLGMAAIVKYVGSVEKAMPKLIAVILLIGVAAAAIWALSILPTEKIAGVAMALGIVFASLIGMLFAITHTKLKFGDAMVKLGAMLIILGAISGVLLYLSNNMSNASNALPIAQSLITVMAGLSAVTFAAQFINATAALKGAAAIAGVSILFAALAELFANLSGWIGDDDLSKLQKGIDIITMIATGLGEALGGLVGGALAGLTSGLSIVADNLSSFAEKLQPFLDSIKSIDEDVITRMDILKDLLGALAGLKFSGNFTSEQITNFTDAMTSFAIGIQDFDSHVGEIKNTHKIKVAAEAIEMLANIKLPTSGGAKGWIFGNETSSDAFGRGLGTLGRGLKGFYDHVSEIGDTTGINNAIEIVQKLASIQLPNSGGILAELVGDNTWAKFGAGLSDFGTTLVDFSDSVKSLTPESVGYIDTAIQVASKLSELEDAFKNTGGVLQEVIGEGSWSSFSTGLVEFGQALVSFTSGEGSVADLTEESVASVEMAKKVATALIDLSSMIPESGGLLTAAFGGKGTWSTFGNGLVEFGASLTQFSTVSAGLNLEAITLAVDAASKIQDLSTDTENLNLSEFGRQLGELGANIQSFATTVANSSSAFESLQTFSTNLQSILQSFNEAGQSSANSYGTGITSMSDAISTAGTNLANQVIAGINLNSEEFLKAGDTSGKKFVDGLEKKKEAAKTAGSTLSTSGKEGASSKYNDWYKAGEDAGQGFIDGIKSKESNAATAGRDIAKAAYDAAKRELDSHSPSRKMMELGGFGGEGFVLGIMQWVSRAAEAATELGEASMTGLSESISRINDEISDTLDTNPVIRPVLDLSGVASGARRINGMINSNSLRATGSSSNETTITNQNGGQSGMTFIQNNYSPKALSRIDIYRQTKNQFAAAKGAIENA